MSYIDHDLAPEGARRAPARPVTAQRSPAGAQSPLLDLQRLAGNAAVTSAIRSGRFDADLPVQRLEDDTDDLEDIDLEAVEAEAEENASESEVEEEVAEVESEEEEEV